MTRHTALGTATVKKRGQNGPDADLVPVRDSESRPDSDACVICFAHASGAGASPLGALHKE